MSNIALESSTARQASELLYHYTTVESFVSIMNSGELWASHIRYQNDISEQRLIWDHVRARIKARLATTSGNDRDRLLQVQSLASSPLELDIYILCFSKDGGDTLGQWRGYGGSAGVAIGFDPSELKKRCRTISPFQWAGHFFSTRSVTSNQLEMSSPIRLLTSLLTIQTLQNTKAVSVKKRCLVVEFPFHRRGLNIKHFMKRRSGESRYSMYQRTQFTLGRASQ